MDKLDKLLDKALAKNNLLKQARSAEICFLADKWGMGLFQTTSFLNGQLKVSVQSSPAASELEMKKEELKDYLNQKLNKNTVKNVRIIISKNTQSY